MGVLDAIRERRRIDTINRVLQQSYEEGTPATQYEAPNDAQGDEIATFTKAAKPGGLNFQNAIAGLMKAGYGTDAMALEQKRDENEIAKLLKTAQAHKYMQTIGGENPSAVREWEYFNKLSPEQQSMYLRMKRADKFLDVGSGYVMPDPARPAATTPIADRQLKPSEELGYVEGKAGATATGKERAEAALELPKAEASTDQTVTLINELRNHPGRKLATGTSSVIPKIPGTSQADFIARLDQLKGKQFLEAFQTLKGGGQITEVEGTKAENALARMDRSQTEPEFLKALDDFQDAVKIGTEKLRQKAGKPSKPTKPNYTQKDLEHTALKHGITVQEVKRRLGIK